MGFEFEEEILIPKTRVAVLIGKKGATKKELETKGHIKLKVASDGSVEIKGHDALEVMVAKNIIEAIGRGFNPEIAILLLKEENAYELIHMENYIGRGKDLRRIRGVLIGKKGKTRKFLEETTKTHISIFGKTIAIIGPAEGVSKARRAVEMFLTGAKHATVYKFLKQNSIKG
ncbi:MAG: KH domain-containing protein [Candidatus Nanoarchaeia archaeon]